MRWRACSSESFALHETSCCTEMNCETLRLAPAAPCSAIARTTSRSVNMPTAVLPSVRTTSLTTSALILLERISWAAMATVSFMRTVATRAAFLRRISPTCMATSLGMNCSKSGIHNTNCQHGKEQASRTYRVQKQAVLLTLLGNAAGSGGMDRLSRNGASGAQVYQTEGP